MNTGTPFERTSTTNTCTTQTEKECFLNIGRVIYNNHAPGFKCQDWINAGHKYFKFNKKILNQLSCIQTWIK